MTVENHQRAPIVVEAHHTKCSQTETHLSVVVPLQNVRGKPEVKLNDGCTEGFVWMTAGTSKGNRPHVLDLSFEGAVHPTPRVETNPRNVVLTFQKEEPCEWLGLPNARREAAPKKKKGKKKADRSADAAAAPEDPEPAVEKANEAAAAAAAAAEA